jgi:dihydroflavonol-4-reductase
MAERALVIGATGFIGGAVVRALVESGYVVRAFRRSAGPAPVLDGLDLEEAHGDLRDSGAVRRALVGCDLLFHAGAYYPRQNDSVVQGLHLGVESIRSVMSAALVSEVRRVVYTSSLSTIGTPPFGTQLASERDYYLPGSVGHAYHEAKYAMEQEVGRYVAKGLPAVLVCPTAVFGPGDVKPTSGTAVLALASGKLPMYIGGKMNVIDVRDVAAGQVTAADKGKLGERYILGGANMTVGDIVRAIAAALGVPAPGSRLPSGLALAAARVAEQVGRLVPGAPTRFLSTGVVQIRHGQYFDTSKARTELGLVTRPVDVTFADTVAWFREHGYL